MLKIHSLATQTRFLWILFSIHLPNVPTYQPIWVAYLPTYIPRYPSTYPCTFYLCTYSHTFYLPTQPPNQLGSHCQVSKFTNAHYCHVGKTFTWPKFSNLHSAKFIIPHCQVFKCIISSFPTYQMHIAKFPKLTHAN